MNVTVELFKERGRGAHKERDEYRAKYNECYLVLNDVIKERDTLAAAAELAFKALCRINDAPINLEHGERLSLAKAIVALRQAGVQ